jgi:hypothetical protein
MSTKKQNKPRGKKAASNIDTIENIVKNMVEVVEVAEAPIDTTVEPNQQITEVECGICRDAYTYKRYPMTFNCGHSVCIDCNKDLYNDCPICKTPIKYRSKNFAMIQMLNCNENADVDKTNKKKLFTHKLDAQIYNTHDLLTMLKHYDKNDVKFNEFAESYKRVLTVKPTFKDKRFSNIKFANGLPPAQCNAIAIFTMFSELNNLTIELMEVFNFKFGIGSATLSPIIVAAIHDNINIIEYFESRGQHINFQNAIGYNALYFACKYSNTTSSINTVKYLLSKGATLIYNKDTMSYLLDLIQCKSCSKDVVSLISEHIYKHLDHSIVEIYTPNTDDQDVTDDDDDEYYNGDTNQIVVNSSDGEESYIGSNSDVPDSELYVRGRGHR